MEQKRGAAAPLGWKTVWLELHPQRELQLTRIRRAVYERSAGNRSINSAGRAEIDVVHDVVRVHAELNLGNLMDWEGLHHRQVHVEQIGPIEAISSQGSDLIQSGRREVCRHGRRIEVAESSVRGAGDLVLEPLPASIHVARSRARNIWTSSKG